LGRTIIDGCNNCVVPKVGNQEDITPTISRGNTMIWHQILGHTREKGLQQLHGKSMANDMSNFTLDFNLCGDCIYGK